MVVRLVVAATLVVLAAPTRADDAAARIRGMGMPPRLECVIEYTAAPMDHSGVFRASESISSFKIEHRGRTLHFDAQSGVLTWGSNELTFEIKPTPVPPENDLVAVRALTGTGRYVHQVLRIGGWRGGETQRVPFLFLDEDEILSGHCRNASAPPPDRVEAAGMVQGIRCGGWSAELLGTETCEELQAFFDEWIPKAEAGDSVAQHMLGMKLRSTPRGTMWFRRAAEQGSPSAQYDLGLAYLYGEGGLLQDFVQAYMWFNLAAAGGYGKAKEVRGDLVTKMTTEQIAEAQRLAREWMEKHQGGE